MKHQTSENVKILFVYNANGGFLQGIKDLVHKTASPATYQCKLCQLTYTGAMMNKNWKQYVANLGVPAVFMHKDDFEKTFPNVASGYPVIYMQSGKTLNILLSARDFSSIQDLNGLMSSLSAKLDIAKPKS